MENFLIPMRQSLKNLAMSTSDQRDRIRIHLKFNSKVIQVSLVQLIPISRKCFIPKKTALL